MIKKDCSVLNYISENLLKEYYSLRKKTSRNPEIQLRSEIYEIVKKDIEYLHEFTTITICDIKEDFKLIPDNSYINKRNL